MIDLVRRAKGGDSAAFEQLYREPVGRVYALCLRMTADPGHDAVRTPTEEILIPKSRPDDFRAEIEHIGELLAGDVKDSPLSLERGLETMLVIAAAIRSSEEGRTVTIDYSRGPCLGALESGSRS